MKMYRIQAVTKDKEEYTNEILYETRIQADEFNEINEFLVPFITNGINEYFQKKKAKGGDE